MSTDGPQTLRWWMDERRGELGLTWQQVADRAGVSTETLYRAADGRQMRTTTRKGIERALEWEPGSVAAVIRGQHPTAKLASEAQSPAADPDYIPAGWSDREEQLWEIARYALPGLLGLDPSKPVTRQRFRWYRDEAKKLDEADG